MRCAVYADERSHVLDDSDDPIGDAVRTVAQSLAEAKRMVMEKAEEMGIDLEAVMNDPEVEASLERQRATVEDTEIHKLAYAYALDSRRLFKDAEKWFPVDGDPMAAEMFEILEWYSMFISAKIHRGLHGILDIDGYEDENQLLDTQSDANGSIKIALIGIERSVLAWMYLMNESNAATLRPEIERLERIRSLAENKFPNAREFMRPGFDEVEIVM